METENQKISILMVDDNPSNLLALETILQAPDRNLVRASSGEEALRYLLDNDAAVILLDVHMPIIDGLETAALIRGRERTRNLPIIFLTAYDSADGKQINQGYSLGAVDYIIKPIDPEALISKVAVFVELFKKTDQVKRQAELLHQKNIELESSNLRRFERLIELGQQLAIEREPESVLAAICNEACDIMEARYATLGVLADDGQELRHFFTCGLDREKMISAGLPLACQVVLRDRFKSQRSIRISRIDEARKFSRLLTGHPLITSFLGAPIIQNEEMRGWLFLANKMTEEDFSEADERFAVTLTQALVFYENAQLHDEAKRHATVLEQEIAERKQAERERAELLEREQLARKEAETANRLKDEFLANVSHELRAPLNAILGWVTLVRNGSLNELDKERALETVERNAHAQKRLIDDLLDVSRIITGKLHLDLRLVDLVTIVESAVESGRPAAESKGVNLQTRIDLKACPLQGDSSRLQQVMWNLISNAIKFTPTGGKVEVQIRHNIDHVEVMVKDTGVGIPQNFLPYVFDRFRQADGSSTRNYGGMGLGLAIVRHLVEMHGGFVRADSDGKGLGATFTITLPLSVAGVPKGVLPLTSESYFLSDTAPRLTGVRVLVVDDENDTRELLEAILSQCEAEVRTAGNVSEAVQIMQTWHAEVVISDLSMPLEDGYSLIEKMRQLEGAREKPIPAIAVTARSGAESRIRALAAGFQMYLEKPVEPDELIVCVASLTGRLSQAQSIES